jgi:protein arginine N-methyltransferase 1
MTSLAVLVVGVVLGVIGFAVPWGDAVSQFCLQYRHPVAAVSMGGPGGSEQPPASAEDLQGYKKINLHETMLSDTVRMRAYRSAILGNRELFENKTVLDVGAGTGILSLWAAKAGAQKVHAAEYHATLSKAFGRVVAANGLEGVIEPHSGPVEALEIGPVDIIVSEWMGYALLYENMLGSVLSMRDRWLKPGGSLLPNTARLFVVGAKDPINHSNKRHFFEDVEGFDMSAYRDWTFREPSIASSIPENILTSAFTLVDLNLETITHHDLDFDAVFSLTAKAAGVVDVLSFFFDVSFTKGQNPVVLTTRPDAPPTHWYQTHFYLRSPYKVAKGDVVQGRVVWRRNPRATREVLVEIDITRDANRKTTDKYAIEY